MYVCWGDNQECKTKREYEHECDERNSDERNSEETPEVVTKIDSDSLNIKKFFNAVCEDEVNNQSKLQSY